MLKYKAKLNVHERKQAAQNRIKEKVAILAKWEITGMSPKALKFSPKSKAAFCKWEDADLEETVLIDGKEKTVHGVFSFTEATLDKPYNSIFKERVVELIAKLNSRRTKKGQNSEIMKLKLEIKEYKVALENITNEFVASRAKVNELERTAAAKQLEIERLMRRLKNLVPLGPERS